MRTSSRALGCTTRHTRRNPPAELSRLRFRPRQATYPLRGKLRISVSGSDRRQYLSERRSSTNVPKCCLPILDLRRGRCRAPGWCCAERTTLSAAQRWHERGRCQWCVARRRRVDWEGRSLRSASLILPFARGPLRCGPVWLCTSGSQTSWSCRLSPDCGPDEVAMSEGRGSAML